MERCKREAVWISLEDLDERPGAYTMSFGFDPVPLVNSIREIGLLNPPLIERDGEGRIGVVAGHRRIVALKTLKEKQVRCIDLSGAGYGPLEKVRISLYDNLATRTFNDVEKGMVLERLTEWVDRVEILHTYMPLLGLPAHETLLQTLVRLGELEHDIRLAISRKRISLPTAGYLLDQDGESRSYLFKWFSSINFNFNQQYQLIDLLTYLSQSTGRKVGSLLSAPPFVALLDDRNLNGPQKLRSALAHLRRMRYPALTDAEKLFHAQVRDLKLPEDVCIRHSPYFETRDFRLEIRFQDGRSLRDRLAYLASLKGLENIHEPWRPPSP